MVGIRDETGDSAENGEWLDLKMGGTFSDLVLVASDEGIVLLVDVKIFNEARAKEVVESDFAVFQ